MNGFKKAWTISFNDEFNLTDSLVFLSGVIPSGLLGYWILRRLANRENGISLSSFQGHVYEHPVMALAFLFACLGLSGFPISPTFIGEDLIFSHINPNEIGLAIIIALSFVLDGIAIVRIYARIFLGPHSKNYHSKAMFFLMNRFKKAWTISFQSETKSLRPPLAYVYIWLLDTTLLLWKDIYSF